jgi:ribonuclease BN (tRNA processing enzyme)
MTDIQVRFIGSGDAFGSGGRFNTCIMISSLEAKFLVDCGASSLVALRRLEVAPESLDMILITHLHGDHFGGLPFMVLDAQLISRRTRPLLLAGPPGLEQRLNAAMEALFPGSSNIERNFELQFREWNSGEPAQLNDVSVIPHQVSHPCGAPPFALRMTCGRKTITYSGDTEWCEGLLEAACGADLFISEACTYDKPIKNHLSFKILEDQRENIGAGRIVITHMNNDMLLRPQEPGWEYAEDGKAFTV